MTSIANGDSRQAGQPFVPAFNGPLGLASLLDDWAYGILVLTCDGRVLHSNQAAQQELGRPDGLSVIGGYLQVASSDQQKILMCAVARGTSGLRSLVTLRCEPAWRLTLAVVPIRVEPPHPPRVALVFARATVCDALMLCFFARAHGLTNTEEQVLAILCQGMSAPEVAAQLKIAVSTVRSHVRSLCVKTQSCGVRELVKRVCLLPPLGPCRVGNPLH